MPPASPAGNIGHARQACSARVASHASSRQVHQPAPSPCHTWRQPQPLPRMAATSPGAHGCNPSPCHTWRPALPGKPPWLAPAGTCQGEAPPPSPCRAGAAGGARTKRVSSRLLRGLLQCEAKQKAASLAASLADSPTPPAQLRSVPPLRPCSPTPTCIVGGWQRRARLAPAAALHNRPWLPTRAPPLLHLLLPPQAPPPLPPLPPPSAQQPALQQSPLPALLCGPPFAGQPRRRRSRRRPWRRTLQQSGS